MNNVEEIEFETFRTKYGQLVYFAEYTTIELEEMFSYMTLKRLEGYDSDGYEAFLDIQTENFIILHPYLGGVVYKSLADYLLYQQHFESYDYIRNKQSYSAFRNKEGHIIKYSFEEIDGEQLDHSKFICDKRYLFGKYDQSYYLLSKNAELAMKFENEKDLEFYLESVGQSVLQGSNPYGKEVLENKQTIISQQLVSILGIEESLLDYTSKSLHIIDHRIDEIAFNDTIFFEIFLGLILYLGDTIILQHPTYSWKLIEESNEIWIPILIKEDDGREVAIHSYLYKSLHSQYFILPNIYLIFDLVTNNPFNQKKKIVALK